MILSFSGGIADSIKYSRYPVSILDFEVRLDMDVLSKISREAFNATTAKTQGFDNRNPFAPRNQTGIPIFYHL